MERYVERCVMSLSRLACEGVEILCVDDGSTDGSGKKCEALAMRDKRVKVIHQDNKGLPAVRNTGLSAAKGEYVTFVDCDDWVDSRLLESFVAVMDGNPDIDMCVGGAVREYPDGSSITMFEESLPKLFQREEALLEMVTGRIFFWYLWGKVYRREVFENFLADETVTTCEDLDSLWRLFQSGKIQNTWYSPKYKYHYYYNTCGMTEGKKRIERHKSDLYVFEKILKDSDGENVGIMDRIRGRAIWSIYSILRELCFQSDPSRDIGPYLARGIAILRKMGVDGNKQDTVTRRMRRMAEDEEYARGFFENAFSSMRKAAAEAESFPEKYIYGTGVASQYVTAMIREIGDFDGFVISDGKPGALILAGKPVYHLSELCQEKNKAVILAVNRKNQVEIRKGLSARGDVTVIVPDIPEDF